MGEENYRFHDHEKLAHYADAAADIEFKFPLIQRTRRNSLPYRFWPFESRRILRGKNYSILTLNAMKIMCLCSRTSVGLDRMFLAVFSWALREEKLEDGSERTVLKLPAVLAPTKVAVLPLVKKDGLPDLAREIVDTWNGNRRLLMTRKTPLVVVIAVKMLGNTLLYYSRSPIAGRQNSNPSRSR